MKKKCDVFIIIVTLKKCWEIGAYRAFQCWQIDDFDVTYKGKFLR